MEEEIALDPSDVGFFGPGAVMASADGSADPVDESGRLGQSGLTACGGEALGGHVEHSARYRGDNSAAVTQNSVCVYNHQYGCQAYAILPSARRHLHHELLLQRQRHSLSLPADGVPVAAGIGAAGERAGGRVACNALSTTDDPGVVRQDANDVASRLQGRPHVRRDAGLSVHGPIHVRTLSGLPTSRRSFRARGTISVRAGGPRSCTAQVSLQRASGP